VDVAAGAARERVASAQDETKPQDEPAEVSVDDSRIAGQAEDTVPSAVVKLVKAIVKEEVEAAGVANDASVAQETQQEDMGEGDSTVHASGTHKHATMATEKENISRQGSNAATIQGSDQDNQHVAPARFPRSQLRESNGLAATKEAKTAGMSQSRTADADRAITNRMTVNGPDRVSLKCSSVKNSADDCVKTGCMMASVQGQRKCVDSTAWSCAVKKKITDCQAFRRYNPVAVNWAVNNFCGRMMFHQKPIKYQQCAKGVRMKQQCLLDTDCPWPNKEMIASLSTRPGQYTQSWSDAHQKKFEKWHDNKGAKCTYAKGDPSCRRYAKCETVMGYVGCQGAVIDTCRNLGFETYVASII